VLEFRQPRHRLDLPWQPAQDQPGSSAQPPKPAPVTMRSKPGGSHPLLLDGTVRKAADQPTAHEHGKGANRQHGQRAADGDRPLP
jgi:hypothetical protein